MYGILLIQEELFTDSSNRPKLPNLSQQECPCPTDYQELIDRCWSFSPATRPTFDQIKKILHRINPQRESPVDMMMIMVSEGLLHDNAASVLCQWLIIRRRLKIHFVDHMHGCHFCVMDISYHVLQMEKYSKHLELLVADRTQELIAEQKKTANLLYAMLPQEIADDLRQGRPAAAQNFQSSTVFFW